jgi:hypothetical protein
MAREYRREVVKRKTGAASLCAGLALLAVLPACGCQPGRQAEPVEDVSEDPYGEALMFASAILRYADAHGRLPDTREMLQDFCQRESLVCASLDWTRVSWQHREKDTLTQPLCGWGIRP